MDVRKFLTIAETALAIGVPKRTAQRLVAEGRLPVVRFSDRVVRVPVAWLDATAAAAIAAAASAEPAEAS